jgi:glycogen synthase
MWNDKHLTNPKVTDSGWTSPMGVRHQVDEFLLTSSDLVERQVANWQRNQEPLRALFEESIGEIEYRRRQVSTEVGQRLIAFLSYENPWAKSGGILAVANNQVDALIEEGERAIRISPYHKNLVTALDISSMKPEARFTVPFDGREVSAAVYKVSAGTSPVRDWYLIDAPGFFELDGGENRTEPYFDSKEGAVERDSADSRLLRDSLFASKAVPYVLRALGHRENVIVHANDWQFASVALTVNEALIDDRSSWPSKDRVLESAAVVLTLHNPYDHFIPPHKLQMITNRVADHHWPPVGDDSRSTILSRMLPLLPDPVCTVSSGFGSELTQSPLQKGYYAPHLQGIFRSQGVVGINNGSFAPKDLQPFSDNALFAAQQGNYDMIFQEKLDARLRMIDFISQFNAPGAIGGLQGGDAISMGGDLRRLDNKIPVHFMYGRFDLGQKGTDIMMEAINSIPRGQARFVIVSWLGSSDSVVHAHLEEIEKLTRRRPGEILFLPQKLTQGFDLVLAGSTFSAWPSIYEPFGGLSEPLSHGTPAIARLTGGIGSQLLRQLQSKGTPLIGYHELPDSNRDLTRQVVELQSAQYPRDRQGQPLYQQQSKALAYALIQGGALYSIYPERYAAGLAGLAEIPKQLDWFKNVGEYRRIYQLATR